MMDALQAEVDRPEGWQVVRAPRARRRRRGWRPLTWAILLWTGFMAFWIQDAARTRTTACLHSAVADCQAWASAGTGIAVVLLGLLWFGGFVILALLWLMRRTR